MLGASAQLRARLTPFTRAGRAFAAALALWAGLAGSPKALAESATALQEPAASATEASATAQKRAEVRISRHAAERLRERGITIEQAKEILVRIKPFPYYHGGRWKNGYYDPEARIFLAEADGVLITAIAGVEEGYIRRLKRKRPGTPKSW